MSDELRGHVDEHGPAHVRRDVHDVREDAGGPEGADGPAEAVEGVAEGAEAVEAAAGVAADGAAEEARHEPAGPAPLGVVRTPTGHAAVDALLARLGDADHLPADGHLEVYEDVHRGLRDELTSLDAAARPGPGPTPTYDHRS